MDVATPGMTPAHPSCNHSLETFGCLMEPLFRIFFGLACARRAATSEVRDESLIASLLHLDYHKIFFVECYMKLRIDPSFCKDGWHDAASNHTVISLPTGNAFPPRAFVLKEILRKFRELFLTQKGSDRISSVQNSKLNVKEGGGLLSTDRIPTEVHSLLFKFLNGQTFKNPAVPIVS
jgi:hypothetical protein